MIPDDYQTADFEVYVEGGIESLTIPVQVSYVNAAGEQVEETQNVHIPLYSDALLSKYGFSNGSNMLLYIVVFVIAVAIVGVVYWRRRRG